MLSWFSQASGMSIMIASGTLRPDCTRSSRTLSRIPESDVSGFTTGKRRSKSGPNRSLRRSACRALIQFTFPWRVLISPLWQRRRMGCARDQLGNVFVENRAWTMARWLTIVSSRRSA
jgi:hypothetical protein